MDKESNGFLLIILLIRMAPSLSSTVNDTDFTVDPIATENAVIRQKIVDSQFKCYERMNREPPYEKKGLFCNRTWDGWLCWDDTPAGEEAEQNCPDYFPDFDPTETASKTCDENGNWFRHPENNRTWSDYTRCNSFTNEKRKMIMILYYMAIVGHALSITSLLISLGIFFYFKSLSCQRITLHKNLFSSYVLNSVFTLAYLIAVVSEPGLVKKDPGDEKEGRAHVKTRILQVHLYNNKSVYYYVSPMPYIHAVECHWYLQKFSV